MTSARMCRAFFTNLYFNKSHNYSFPSQDCDPGKGQLHLNVEPAVPAWFRNPTISCHEYEFWYLWVSSLELEFIPQLVKLRSFGLGVNTKPKYSSPVSYCLFWQNCKFDFRYIRGGGRNRIIPNDEWSFLKARRALHIAAFGVVMFACCVDKCTVIS